MEARKAYKMIQWYNVYSGEVGSDNEDYSIYSSLLDSFIDCHDYIEEVGMTYHEYYLYFVVETISEIAAAPAVSLPMLIHEPSCPNS
jgi:hypothetical protein